jgi:hypothetical protein
VIIFNVLNYKLVYNLRQIYPFWNKLCLTQDDLSW